MLINADHQKRIPKEKINSSHSRIKQIMPEQIDSRKKTGVLRVRNQNALRHIQKCVVRTQIQKLKDFSMLLHRNFNIIDCQSKFISMINSKGDLNLINLCPKTYLTGL